MSDIDPLAAQIRVFQAGTQVVAWQHHLGERLARRLLARLGGNPDDVPQWQDSDFESIFVVRFSGSEQGLRRVSFDHEREGLDDLPGNCSAGLRRTRSWRPESELNTATATSDALSCVNPNA